MTMTLVETVTLGSAQTSINFTSVPQSGTDLLLVTSLRTNIGIGFADSIFIRFNNDTTATNYRIRNLAAEATSVSSQNINNSQIFCAIEGSGFTSNTFASSAFYIPNYAGSAAKSFSVEAATENNDSLAGLGITAGSWNSTSAITSVTLEYGGSSFVQYSTASLYTITKGSGGATVS